MYDDKDQFELSRYKWIIPFVVIVLIISILMVRCSTDNLKGYTDSSSLTDSLADSSSNDDTGIVEKVDTISEETYPYNDEELKISLEIPQSWSKISGANHNVSFIDKNYGTQLNVKVSAYSPEINSINENYLTQQAYNNGMEIREYKSLSNSSYAVSYASTSYAYIDYTYWDFDHVITLNFMFDNSYYNDTKLNQTIKFINSSFKWTRSNAIPDDLQMAYFSYGNFEFGYPIGWNYGESSNSILITNEEGSAAINVSVNEAATSLEGISQIDCVNFLSQTKPGFMLSSFDNNGSMITITGTYVLNNVKLNLQEYILVNNGYEYTISFDTESQVTSDLAVTIQKVINSFRCF